MMYKRFYLVRTRTVITCLVAAALVAALPAFVCEASEGEPLSVEITPEHPLLVFSDPALDFPDAAAYAQHVTQAYKTLSPDLQSFSAIQVDCRGADIAARHQWYRQLLMTLQDADVPVVIRIADSDLSQIYPLKRVEELLEDFTCVKGIQATELPFEEYYDFGDSEIGTPPVVRWLMDAADLAANSGRFFLIELDKIRWPRVMSNAWCAPLYAKIQERKTFVIPIAQYRGQHSVPQTAALMGLWLEDAVTSWGIGPTSRWYSDARFLAPDVFGSGPQAPAMPSALYRAMIVNGAMTGAVAYSFGCGRDLWFGDSRKYWDEAIYPTLSELVQGGLIARQDFVRKKVKAAYQLANSRTAEDFHLNLRDIDGVLDKGFLMHGAYGMERPGQVPELILNTGNHYWVPILSAYAPQQAVAQFESVIHPGTMTSPAAWTELLDKVYARDGEGTAFISRIGRGTFIMNTSENGRQRQTFRVAALPAPVRGVTAKRDAGAVALEWPFREGDLSYKVYRRTLEDPRFTMLAGPMEERRYADTPPDSAKTYAYAVTALTDDAEPFEGAVDYGEYLILSNVESRIAEEVILSPLLLTAESRPTAQPGTSSAASDPWWPNYKDLTPTQSEPAAAIVKRIEDWDRAFSQENLDETLRVYSPEYSDAQGWQIQYVRRAYKWFFEHYGMCAMHRQIRRWDFSNYDQTGQVGVLLYCRFEGYALSDPTGRAADLPAWFPRTETSEAWLYFTNSNGVWQIARTDPPIPNFRDILSFSASPYDAMTVGADQ